MNIKDKVQRMPNSKQVYIGSSKYESGDYSNQGKHKYNTAERVRRHKKGSIGIQFNDEQNIESLRCKPKGRKSTSGKKGNHEINKGRNVCAEESYESSSADDRVARKSLICLLHVQSKKHIHDLQNADTEKNSTVLERGDNKQIVSKTTNNTKRKTIKHKNIKHENNIRKDNRNKKCTKTVVDCLSSNTKKYQMTESPITTNNSYTSSKITNISQAQQIIAKQNRNLSDNFREQENKSIKESLKNLKPSKYKSFTLILKKMEQKITKDIEKKLRKVLKMPDIKTYFENTLLASTNEKKTISTLIGAIMQIIFILESRDTRRKKKCYSDSRRDESVEDKQSAYYYVTNQQGNYDSKFSTNTNSKISTSNETNFTQEDIKNKHIMKCSKKKLEENLKKKRISKIKPQNYLLAGNNIDVHLSKAFDSSVASKMSKLRTVRKYKRRSFENKFNFEFKSMFKDSSSVITQNYNTYSTNVITNSNTHFVNKKTNNSLFNKKDLKLLSLLNEIFHTPNITDDKLNKLSLAVLKNFDCCIDKEDIPYIAVEMNKLVKYSKDIYDQIYNVYKTVNTLKSYEKNIFLPQDLFSERKYNETILPRKDNVLHTVPNAECKTYDTYKTETSDKCVGSEKADERANASLDLNAKLCYKSKLSYDYQEMASDCFDNSNIAINTKGEPVTLKSTQSEKDKMLHFREMSVDLPQSRKYVCAHEPLDKKPNINDNILSFNIATTEPVPIKRKKYIYEPCLKKCAQKSNFQEIETIYFPRNYSQEKNITAMYQSYFKCGADKSNIQETQTQENDEKMIHKTSDFFDIEMTDDLQYYSSDIYNESGKSNEQSTNCFINSTNVPFSENYNPEIITIKKPNNGRCKSERIRTALKRKYVIDCENRPPKIQCIEDKDDCLLYYCVSQHKIINLARRKHQLSDNFKTRTAEKITHESNDSFMYPNKETQNFNDSLKSQQNISLYSIHKYDDITCIQQNDPQFCCSMIPESQSKQNSLVNECQEKYKTNFSNHKISYPYPTSNKNKYKAALHNPKNKLVSNGGFTQNYATFGKNKGFGESCNVHHKIIQESNGTRIIVEDIDGKTYNSEDPSQNGKHILTNTTKNSKDQAVHTDALNSMEQKTNNALTAGTMTIFTTNDLENMLHELEISRKMLYDSQFKVNSFICLRDNNIFRKPHFEEQSEPQKQYVSNHSLIGSEAEYCSLSNTLIETANATHKCININNLVHENNFVHSYVNNPQHSSNYNAPTQSVVETALQKDLKCSNTSLQASEEGCILDLNTKFPLQLNKDSLNICLKKDECIEITLNGLPHQNVNIQKVAKISEEESKEINKFMKPEILDHASVSSKSINSSMNIIIGSTKEKSKINHITPTKINTPFKKADFENVNNIDDQYCYIPKLTKNRYNTDKNVQNTPVEMTEAQNINVYYCSADGQNSKRLFHSPNPNKSSYIPFFHYHGYSSLNKNETNTDKNHFKCVNLPQNPCLLKNEYFKTKQIQIPTYMSEPDVQENRSGKSSIYDSSQFHSDDSNQTESRESNRKGLKKISWSTLFSKLFQRR